MNQPKPKIFVIEDYLYDWERIYDCLNDFNVDIYPSTTDEFDLLAKKLREFAVERNELNREVIEKLLSDFLPDVILLDISLLNSKVDNSGVVIYEDIINKNIVFLETYVGVFTTWGATVSLAFDDTKLKRFNKNEVGDSSIEIEMQDEIIPWLKTHINLVDKFENPADTPLQVNQDKQEKVSEIIETSCPSWILKIFPLKQVVVKGSKVKLGLIDRIRLKVKKLFLLSQTFVHYFVLFCFYVMIFFFAVTGSVFLVYEVLHMAKEVNEQPGKNYEMINIAEYAFVAFLPLLVVISFYLFYDKSLGLSIKRQGGGGANIDEASKVMKVIKKLFISSIVSYLFIKMIEVIVPSSQGHKDLNNGDFIRIFFLAGTILFLIGYYVYLEYHKQEQNIDEKS
nr:hypothetical protein [uncultured Mucilaginibacter sp.]